MKTIVILLTILLCPPAAYSQITLTSTPTFTSVGYTITFPNSDSTIHILPGITYRKSDDPQWKEGFSPSFNSRSKQWRGSLFMLDSNTKYYIKVTVTVGMQPWVIIDSVTTLLPPIITPMNVIKYVSPFGSGTVYSSTMPGNLQALLATDIPCGTTVILKGGSYHIGDIVLKLYGNCTEGTPVTLMAAPGEHPVFDGGDTTRYTWTPTPGDSSIYSTTSSSDIAFTSLCLMNDTLRLYPYGLLTPAAFPYPSLSDLGYDLSGFFRRDSTFYFKTLDRLNPNKQHLTFSKESRCMTIEGNNKNNYLFIQGITFKHYAKPIITKNILSLVDGDYPATALTFRNTNHVVLDNCRFEFCNWPVNFSDSCNYTVVQNCTFQDGVGKYSHGAFKQTRDAIVLEQGTYGRYMEYCAINFGNQSRVTVIRNNSADGYIGGLVGKGLAADLASEETDIYNNLISNSYNGINSDGGSINTRIWNNTLHHCSVGLSFINAGFGPNYIFRNVLHHIIERRNHNDIFFMNCDNTSSTKIWGTGVKLNASARATNPPDMFFIHNTFHSADTLAFSMYLWNSTWKSIFSRNNIYYSEGMSSFFLDGINNDSLYNFNSRNDCYYNKNNTIAIIQPVNGIPKCSTYSDISTFDTGLRNTTNDNRCSVSKGIIQNPLFLNIIEDNYALSPTSTLIDKGEIIQGFNVNFSGFLPDIGAKEYFSTSDVYESNLSETTEFSVYPNPATSSVSIRYSGRYRQEQFALYSLLGEKIASVSGWHSSNESKIATENLAGGVYYIQSTTTGKTIPIVILND